MCAFLMLYGKITNPDIDVLLEISEAITVKIVLIVSNDLSTIVRPKHIVDKTPIIAYSPIKNKVTGN